jgi:hypothetical protein
VEDSTAIDSRWGYGGGVGKELGTILLILLVAYVLGGVPGKDLVEEFCKTPANRNARARQ